MLRDIPDAPLGHHGHMASVSAFVTIGSPHQNDNGIGPHLVAELWEGDRTVWALRSFDGSIAPRNAHPEAPELIFDSFVDLIRDLYPGPFDEPATPQDVSLVVTMLGGSTLLEQADRFKTLSSFDVHLAPVAWSRIFSAWNEEWVEGV